VFRQLGVVVGVSLVQGGSGYPFFAPAVYSYLCGQDISRIKVEIGEIPDLELKDFLEKVRVLIT
jgi:hypothetical protein